MLGLIPLMVLTVFWIHQYSDSQIQFIAGLTDFWSLIFLVFFFFFFLFNWYKGYWNYSLWGNKQSIGSIGIQEAIYQGFYNVLYLSYIWLSKCLIFLYIFQKFEKSNCKTRIYSTFKITTVSFSKSHYLRFLANKCQVLYQNMHLDSSLWS